MTSDTKIKPSRTMRNKFMLTHNTSTQNSKTNLSLLKSERNQNLTLPQSFEPSGRRGKRRYRSSLKAHLSERKEQSTDMQNISTSASKPKLKVLTDRNLQISKFPLKAGSSTHTLDSQNEINKTQK